VNDAQKTTDAFVQRLRDSATRLEMFLPVPSKDLAAQVREAADAVERLTRDVEDLKKELRAAEEEYGFRQEMPHD